MAKKALDIGASLYHSPMQIIHTQILTPRKMYGDGPHAQTFA